MQSFAETKDWFYPTPVLCGSVTHFFCLSKPEPVASVVKWWQYLPLDTNVAGSNSAKAMDF
jgi:hypothetical protein